MQRCDDSDSEPCGAALLRRHASEVRQELALHRAELREQEVSAAQEAQFQEQELRSLRADSRQLVSRARGVFLQREEEGNALRHALRICQDELQETQAEVATSEVEAEFAEASQGEGRGERREADALRGLASRAKGQRVSLLRERCSLGELVSGLQAAVHESTAWCEQHASDILGLEETLSARHETFVQYQSRACELRRELHRVLVNLKESHEVALEEHNGLVEEVALLERGEVMAAAASAHHAFASAAAAAPDDVLATAPGRARTPAGGDGVVSRRGGPGGASSASKPSGRSLQSRLTSQRLSDLQLAK